MSDATPLSHEELLRLWETGKRVAQALCARSLQALHGGEGGFYETDDFYQDLFLEFWELARRWHAGRAPRRHDDLWAAWRERLRHGGNVILRRSPQRLWRRDEPILDPSAFDGATDAAAEGAPVRHGLALVAREVVLETADPEVVLERWAGQEEAEVLLSRLSTTRRQALYLTAVEGLSYLEAARCLWLQDETAVRRCIHRARVALRREREARDALPERGRQP